MYSRLQLDGGVRGEPRTVNTMRGKYADMIEKHSTKVGKCWESMPEPCQSIACFCICPYVCCCLNPLQCCAEGVDSCMGNGAANP